MVVVETMLYKDCVRMNNNITYADEKKFLVHISNFDESSYGKRN